MLTFGCVLHLGLVLSTTPFQLWALAHLMHDVQLGIFNFIGKNEYMCFWKAKEMCYTSMTLNVFTTHFLDTK